MITSRPMDSGAIERLLAAQRIVRVTFSTPLETYLLPLGYLWQDGAFYLLTSRGKKTRMAEANSRVAFQVDDSPAAGVWGWSSVTGEALWEPVHGAAEVARLLPPLFARFPETPARVWRRVAASLARGDSMLVRLRPVVLHGVTQAEPGVE